MSVECDVTIINYDYEDGVTIWKTFHNFMPREKVEY